jgi:hypothetical protein
MLHHTIFDRVSSLLKACVEIPVEKKTRKVICIYHDRKERDSLTSALDRQCYEDKELVPIEGIELDAFWSRAVAEKALVVRMHGDDLYEKHFLLDMALAFFYSDAEMVTKLSYYKGDELCNDGHQFKWVDRVQPRALMIDPKKVGLKEAERLWNGDAVETTRKCLCLDEFNFTFNGRNAKILADIDV